MAQKRTRVTVEVTNRKNLLHKEPTVINEKLIVESIKKQLPKGDEGRYAKQAGIYPRKTTSLLIEFQSISQINNIQHMVLLKKLSLCNNVIVAIENLDTLVNLEHLDLSFNCIRRIENLDNLRKIRSLNFHRNLITSIEGLDNLLRLEVLVLSTNGLKNLENVKYLRQFIRLRGLCLDGNPMCTDPNYKPFVLAFVPQLISLDFKRIPRTERNKAEGLYQERIEKLRAIEDHSRRRASIVEAEEEVLKVHESAFADGLQGDEFWESLYEDDEEGMLILSIGDTEDAQNTYRELFRRTSTELFNKAMRAFTMRQNEFTAFDVAVKETKDEVRNQCIRLTEEFSDYSRGRLREIRMTNSKMEEMERKAGTTERKKLPAEYKDLGDALHVVVLDYVKTLHKLWYTVMTAEVELNEQIVEVGQELDRSVRELTTGWLEQLRGHVAALRDIQLQYHEQLNEALITFGEFRMSDTNIPENLKLLVTDKEALAMVVQASHETHCSIIDFREENMVSRLKTWLELAMNGIRTNELRRSRSRISEISHFTDTHIGYLRDMHVLARLEQNKYYVPDVRVDQDHVPDKAELKQIKKERKLELKSKTARKC